MSLVSCWRAILSASSLSSSVALAAGGGAAEAEFFEQAGEGADVKVAGGLEGAGVRGPG